MRKKKVENLVTTGMIKGKHQNNAKQKNNW